MPKINVYLPDELAGAVRDARVPVSAICQAALERAVRDVSAARRSDQPPPPGTPAVGLFTRFTPRAKRAMGLAQQAAMDIPHASVGTEHIMLGVIEEGGNVAITVIASLDVEPDDLRRELLGSMSPAASAVPESVPFSSLAKEALEATAKEALALGHNYIGCEHLLLGLLRTEMGLAGQVLRRLGLELRTTRRAVVTALSGRGPADGAQSAALDPTTIEPQADTIKAILSRLDAIEDRLTG